MKESIITHNTIVSRTSIKVTQLLIKRKRRQDSTLCNLFFAFSANIFNEKSNSKLNFTLINSH